MPKKAEDTVMWFSLAVAIVLLLAKVTAAGLTGSSSIYSDAAESVVHLFAVAFAAWALRFSRKPADESHHYGHDKAAFLSSGFEGAMISVAAVLIIYDAVKQFFTGVAIEHLGVGAAITGGALVVNLVLGISLKSVGKKRSSMVLVSNGTHVLTDVWTSAAVLMALALYHFTGWPWWDPLIAIAAALNIMRSGWGLIRQSMSGLMDASDPVVENQIRELLDREATGSGLAYHNLRHRHSGRIQWVEFHLVFDDETSVRDAHHKATILEGLVADLLKPDGRVISHLEPKSAENRQEEWEKSPDSK
ncbi:MAG: cation diffusion facilitator family transporter [Verrucomicrobiota bacterium]